MLLWPPELGGCPIHCLWGHHLTCGCLIWCDDLGMSNMVWWPGDVWYGAMTWGCIMRCMAVGRRTRVPASCLFQQPVWKLLAVTLAIMASKMSCDGLWVQTQQSPFWCLLWAGAGSGGGSVYCSWEGVPAVLLWNPLGHPPQHSSKTGRGPVHSQEWRNRFQRPEKWS